MTGPEGERSDAYRVFRSVEQSRSFSAIEGFAHPDGSPNDDLPTMTMDVRFAATTEGSMFVHVTTFPDLAAMEQLAAMGFVEGVSTAFGQMDDVLADLAAFAAGRGTESKVLDDRRVRFTRLVRGTVEQVWRAHHVAELMQRWMLGPDGWSMPVCEPPGEVGTTFRYGWEAEDGSGGFGFEGEVLESLPPHREVTTEKMAGMDGEPSTNEMTLTHVGGLTLVALVVTYPSTEVRDQVLVTGMVDGMEASYARLESLRFV